MNCTAAGGGKGGREKTGCSLEGGAEKHKYFLTKRTHSNGVFQSIHVTFESSCIGDLPGVCSLVGSQYNVRCL